MIGGRFESILDMQVMMEGIGPELGIKARAQKHSMKGIGNSEVGTFNRSILAGIVRASGADGVVVFFKQFANLRVVVEFSTLVHDDTLVGAGG